MLRTGSALRSARGAGRLRTVLCLRTCIFPDFSPCSHAVAHAVYQTCTPAHMLRNRAKSREIVGYRGVSCPRRVSLPLPPPGWPPPPPPPSPPPLRTSPPPLRIPPLSSSIAYLSSSIANPPPLLLHRAPAPRFRIGRRADPLAGSDSASLVEVCAADHRACKLAAGGQRTRPMPTRMSDGLG